ncbi:MAG: hypothetical protein AB1642_13335 [Pseudomonadota bacterium]
MSPAVRDTIDALIGVALFFAAQAAIEEIDMIATEQTGVPVATTLPRSEEATRDLLQLAGVEVDVDDIAQWSDWKIQKAEDWAGSVALHKNAGTTPMAMPSFLNRYITSDGEVRP